MPPLTLSSGGSRSRRGRILALCALPVAALFAVVALVPLPFTVAQPGITANVLGAHSGQPVLSVSGQATRDTEGRLLMTTIAATPPDADVGLEQVISGWFETDRVVMPTNAVYPVGDTPEEVREHSSALMRKSQRAAVSAALNELGLSPDQVEIRLRLANVGGPSAGLLFALGIIAKLEGDGQGGSLTGGRTIAGTGTIEPNGQVGPVGGVALKTRAASRDGASVFLVPKKECEDALVDKPEGLRLIPVTTLDSALRALAALDNGGRVPSC